jgi:predicted 2-oxoglutarate/Fe(II)-dependent dioxygenase YbiX
MVEFSGRLGELKPALIRCTKAMRIFNERMGFDLANCLKTEIGILHYKQGGQVGMHIDTIGLCTRKAVMTIMLSDDTFEGGRFVIDTGMENMPVDTSFDLSCGEMLCFPSYYPHCLEEVTSGERYILVVGFHGDQPFK